MAKKIKSYIRKNPVAGIYQSTVGEGDDKKTIIIKDRNCFNTNDKDVQKFLDNDPEIVLAEVEAPEDEEPEDDENQDDKDDKNFGEQDPGEQDPGDADVDED